MDSGTYIPRILDLPAEANMAWQLLDEVKLLVEDEIPSNDDIEGQ